MRKSKHDLGAALKIIGRVVLVRTENCLGVNRLDFFRTTITQKHFTPLFTREDHEHQQTSEGWKVDIPGWAWRPNMQRRGYRQKHAGPRTRGLESINKLKVFVEQRKLIVTDGKPWNQDKKTLAGYLI